MKSPIAFSLGVATGAIIACLLFSIFQSHERLKKEAEMATLRENLSSAQSAVRDREALHAKLQELQASRATVPLSPPASVAPPTPAAAVASNSADPNSSAIATYLGTPVPAPANLDHKYSPEEISAVFRDLSDTLGIKIEKLAVDTTEFPFIIHGRVESAAGSGFFKKIDSELRALPGYTYGGSVTGSTKDGATYFALNMTPSSAYPREQAEAIHRRMMLRLQMAAAASGDPRP